MAFNDFSPENISITAFFSGHRCICEEERESIRNHLYQVISASYEAGYRRFYCGCALGFDTEAALQTIRFRDQHPDTRLLLAIPCETQSERWSMPDREIYGKILQLADETTVLSPVYYQGVMMARNRYMADRSSLCICWMNQWSGGTASTVRYALLHKQIKVINLAVSNETSSAVMREKAWNYIFTSPSANKNADTAPLRLLLGRKITIRNM